MKPQSRSAEQTRPCRPLWLVVVMLMATVRVGAEATVPELFDIEEIERLELEPTVRNHILSLHREAQQHRREADPVGKLGMSLQAYGLYELAENCYRRANALSPRSFRWLYHLGIIQGWLGRYEGAARTMQRAASLETDSGLARLRLAEFLFESAKVNESMNVFQVLVNERPRLAAAHFGLGRAWSALEEWERAIHSYQRALDIFPGYAAAHYGLGLAYRRLGKLDMARYQLRQYERSKNAQQPPEDPFLSAVNEVAQGSLTHFAAGSLLIQQGKLGEAAAAFERALDENPRLVLAHTNLILIYAKLNKPGKAKQHFRRSLEIAPGSIEAHMNWASVLVLQGRRAEAVEALKTAVALNPYYAEAHVQLGSLLEEAGEREQSLKQYELALQDDPTHRQAHYLLGRHLVQRGKFDQGIAHLLKTIEVLDEKTPICLQTLSMAYRYSGQMKQARLYLQQAHQKAVEFGMERLAAQLKQELQGLPDPVKP